jgi:uncharacterized protein involved in outer membrane biogenesis
MRRGNKILLAILLVLAAIIATIALIAQSDQIERFAERRISAGTDREARIGDIDFGVGRCLHISVRDLYIGNPKWARSPALIDAQAIDACVRWLPLFIGRVAMREVSIDKTRLGLERDGDRVTWQLDEKDKERGGSRVSAQHVSVHEGSVYFRDSEQDTDLNIDVNGGVGGDDVLDLRALGKLRGASVNLVARTPAQMPSVETPASVSAAGSLGHTTVAAAGRFTELGVDGMDIDLTLAGDDLSELNKLGINLPGTPPYALRGRLKHQGDEWNFAPFEGRVGDSDLSGSFSYLKQSPRPLLRADVHAHLLDFDDLGPMVGVPPKTGSGETASPEQKAEARAIAKRDRVLPDKPLGMEKWPRMDADVKFRAGHVKRSNALPIDGLNTHLKIEDSKLTLQPLQFDIAGGHIDSNISLDGKARPPRGHADFKVSKSALSKLFPQVSSEKAAAGNLFGRAKLDMRGDSIASLAASADGNLVLMVNGGHMSGLLIELAGLDAGEALTMLGTRDHPVPLRCAIADFKLNDGKADTQLFVIDTVDTLFKVDGSVNLGDETLDLKLSPQPKDESILVARTPIMIKGSFHHPSVLPEPVPLAARGAAAVLMGLVNPLLALIPLIETGPGKDSDCGALAARARQAVPRGKGS